MKSGWIVIIGLMAVSCVACGSSPTSPTSTSTMAANASVFISLQAATAQLHVGESYQYSVKVTVTGNAPGFDTTPVWTSGNTAVLTVDAHGLATAVSVGDAVLTMALGSTAESQAIEIAVHVLP
jgi:hypothetical protein